MEKQNKIVQIKEEANIRKPIMAVVNDKTIFAYPDNLFDKAKNKEILLKNWMNQPGMEHGILQEMDYLMNHADEINPRSYKSRFYFNVTPQYNSFNLEMMDSVAVLMMKTASDYNEKCIFLNAEYRIKTDDEGDADGNAHTEIKVTAAKYECDLDALANYLFESRFKNLALMSQKNSQKSPHYYYFNPRTYRHSLISRVSLEGHIRSSVQNILSFFNFNRKIKTSTAYVTGLILDMFEQVDDMDGNIIDSYSKEHPNYIQFRDTVYDYKTHRVAKMTPEHRLIQYHNYRIPSGTLDLDVLTAEDGFVDLPVSYGEITEQAQLMIDRSGITVPKETLEFFFTFLGCAMQRDPNILQVSTILQGGAGIGKSELLLMIQRLMFGVGNTSSAKQEEFEHKSQFTRSAFIGKNLNVMAELKGTTMTKEFINFIKSGGDLVQVEEKMMTPYTTMLYVRLIAACNFGQLPYISTSDINDEGLLRRIALIICNDEPEDEWHDRFPLDGMQKAIPAFSLYCLMTFKKNVDNGNVRRFTRQKGVNGGVIDGFIPSSLVHSTSTYFRSHDRFRRFFRVLLEKYMTTESYEYKNEEIFRHQYDTLKTADDISKEFKEYYEEEYPDTKGVTKDKFLEYMANVHQMVSVRRQVTVANNEKRRREMFTPVDRKSNRTFSDIVFEINRQDNPDYMDELLNGRMDESELYSHEIHEDASKEPEEFPF